MSRHMATLRLLSCLQHSSHLSHRCLTRALSAAWQTEVLSGTFSASGYGQMTAERGDDKRLGTRPLGGMVGAQYGHSGAAILLRPLPPCQRHNFLQSMEASTPKRGWSSGGSGSHGIHGSGLFELKLAQTGEGIAECELIRWFVEEGEQISAFQPVCEVQSDKATVEITSRHDGKVVRTHFVPGDIVKVGEVLCDLLMADANSSSSASEPILSELPPSSHSQPSSCSSPLTDSPGHGSGPHRDREVLATPAVRHLARCYGLNLAELSGTGRNGRVLKDDVLRGVVERQGVEYEARSEEYAFEGHETSLDETRVERGEGEVERVLTRAEEQRGTDELQREESGREVERGEAKEERRRGGDSASRAKDEVIPIRGYRRTMAKTMASANEVPHFYYMEEVEVSSLVDLRDALKEEAKREGVKLSHMPLVVKALSHALLQYPTLNAIVNADVTEIHCKGSHNIGIAMATPTGLVVPNIKNCQSLSVLQIAHELARLRQLASENRLPPDDVTGGTITVSNVGSIGGTYAGPLLSPPQVAIVALGRIQRLPRFTPEGEVYPASIMHVSWAADHRVIDGASLAGLCTAWKRALEHPEGLLLHLR